VANSPQAIKRARQNVKVALHNGSQRSEMRTSIKKVVKLSQSGEVDQAKKALLESVVKVDKMAGKGIIHPNKAARLKSRLNRRVKALVTQK
jgi:small subunit ribosomal protein S20